MTQYQPLKRLRVKYIFPLVDPPPLVFNYDMSRVLILGSSFIAKPVVSYLSQFQSIDITIGDSMLNLYCVLLHVCIASNQLKQAEGIASKYGRTKAVELSVHDTSDLSRLVGKHDLVIRCARGHGRR